MSNLNITEYQHAERGPEGTLQMPLEDDDTVRQNVTLGALSTQSAAFGTKTRYVRLCADVDCYFNFGTNPSAATTYSYLPAGMEAWRAVPIGQSWKVAART